MDKKRIPFNIYLIYGVGVSYAIIDQLFAQWVLYYYLPPNNSGLQPIMAPIYISLALAISRFVDMSIDPFIGHFSDSFDSKWGRRIPFMAIGGIPLGIISTLFFFPIKQSEILSFVYLSVIGALFFIAYSLVAGPYNAIIPEIGLEKEERLNLSTWQSVFRLFYTALAVILPGFLITYFGKDNADYGMKMMAVVLSVIAILGVYITVFFLPEKKYSFNKKVDISLGESFRVVIKDKNFVFYLIGYFMFFLGFNNIRASMNYFIEDIIGAKKVMITIVSAIMFFLSAISFYPTNKLVKKFGYRKLMIISQIFMGIVAILLFFLGRGIPAKFGIYIFGIVGIPIAGAAFIFPVAMLSEISSKISKEKGINIEGMYYGIQGFVLNLAFLMSIVLLPIILSSGSEISFIEAILQKPERIEKSGIYLTALFSVFCFGLSAIFYKIYKEED